jgi:hypothetical protein
MILALVNYSRKPAQILRYAGYEFREKDKDWIRLDGNGRWHAKLVEGTKNIVAIHYDLFVEGRHVVFDLPIKGMAEKHRLLHLAHKFKLYELSAKKLAKIMQQYSDWNTT